jgi:hypothetical protein
VKLIECTRIGQRVFDATLELSIRRTGPRCLQSPEEPPGIGVNDEHGPLEPVSKYHVGGFGADAGLLEKTLTKRRRRKFLEPCETALACNITR